jgi:ATP-dependent protease ClpP protease subunit
MPDDSKHQVRLRLQAERCIVLLDGDLSTGNVQQVLPDLAQAMAYYRYEKLHLHVTNSAGGELAAVEMLETFLLHARQRGVQVSTSALYRAHSAAALLLALGDPGLRFAIGSVSLLFHNSRHLIPKDTMLLAEHLSFLQQEATRFAERYPRLLAARAAGVNPIVSDAAEPTRPAPADIAPLSPAVNSGQSPPTPRAPVPWGAPTESTYAELFRRDVPLSAAEALELRLIDAVLTGPHPHLEGVF